VIGAGPAGLTGALYLARFRRRVLVIDDGRSRAVKIPRTHNMPGYPQGVAGAALIASIRRQAERYGVEFAGGRVEVLEKDGMGFVARWPGDESRGRLVLLATGASDIQPGMPHLAEAVRTGAIRYCPVCDAYEVIDCRVGILANGPQGVKEALYLAHFTSDLHVFLLSAEDVLDEKDRHRLAEAGIRLVSEPVTSIRLVGGEVVVAHGDAETRCDSVYCALGMCVHAELAGDAERDEEGYLVTDRHRQTTVEGLYAAGDVVQGLNQITVAMGDAAIAAAAMHLVLSRHDRRQGGS
jgi:thioredoxin reductase (NADPH)